MGGEGAMSHRVGRETKSRGVGRGHESWIGERDYEFCYRFLHQQKEASTKRVLFQINICNLYSHPGFTRMV